MVPPGGRGHLAAAFFWFLWFFWFFWFFAARAVPVATIPRHPDEVVDGAGSVLTGNGPRCEY
jgi:hypothetical protein